MEILNTQQLFNDQISRIGREKDKNRRCDNVGLSVAVDWVWAGVMVYGRRVVDILDSQPLVQLAPTTRLP